jgi:hypothetical protein
MLDLSITVDPIIANCPPPAVVSPPESWLWHIVVWVLCLMCLGLGTPGAIAVPVRSPCVHLPAGPYICAGSAEPALAGQRA